VVRQSKKSKIVRRRNGRRYLGKTV
jgi:hypothetical protein